MKRNKCPQCGRLLVESAGNPDSEILLIGEYPGWEELRDGVPFTGRTGQVLRDVLAREGIDIHRCRLTNLWLHEHPTKDRPCDINYHVKCLTRELKGRKYALAMGSDVCRLITGVGAMSKSGLRVANPLSAAITYIAPNPATVFHGTVGELYLAVHEFAKEINK